MIEAHFKQFYGGFKGICVFVSRKIQWCFKGISRKFLRRVKEISRVAQESFYGILRKFQGCFKED